MTEAALIVVAMIASGVIPLIWLTYLMRRGKAGLALWVLVVLALVLAGLVFATGRPVGIDPLQAWSIALLFGVPACAGASAGALLGAYLWWKRGGRISWKRQ